MAKISVQICERLLFRQHLPLDLLPEANENSLALEHGGAGAERGTAMDVAVAPVEIRRPACDIER